VRKTGLTRKNLALTLLLLSVLALASATLLISFQPAKAQPTFKNVPLPSSIPVAILYQGGYIWTAGYDTGALYKIDLSTQTVVGTWYVTGSENPDLYLYGIAFDGLDIWLTKRGPTTYEGALYKFSTATETFTEIVSGIGDATNIAYLNGYIYVARTGGVTKVEVATNTLTQIDFPDGVPYGYYGIIPFGSNILVSRFHWYWQVDPNGKLFEIETSTNTYIERLSGLHRPLGMTLSGSTLYIAENVRTAGDESLSGWSPAIAIVDTNTWTYIRQTVTGTPYGVGAFSYEATT